MVRSQPIYELKRTFSLAASGIQLDCESTTPLLEKEAEEEDELQKMWLDEQERRKQFDLRRAAEMRAVIMCVYVCLCVNVCVFMCLFCVCCEDVA